MECYYQKICASASISDDFRVSSDKDAGRSDIVSQNEKLVNVYSNRENMEWNGMKWNRMTSNHNSKTGIFQISMKRGVENMLNDFGTKDCKPDNLLAVPGSKLR